MSIANSLRVAATRIEARTRRERVLLLAATAAIVILGWDALVRAPLAERHRVALERVAQSEEQIAALRASERTLSEQIAALSASRVDEQAAVLAARVGVLDRELQARTQGLISPHQMVAVLRELLAGDARLELMALRNEAAEPVVTLADAGAAGDAIPRVYRHRVEVVLRGEYFALLEYLQRVEGLEWRFRWDALDIATLDYPLAEAVIVLSTLSFAQGWIGV